MAISGSRIGTALVCFGLGVVAARIAVEPVNQLHADDRKGPDAFLSGGARSEKVLVEILATLKQLDGRVAGIEDVLKSSDELRPGEGSATRK